MTGKRIQAAIARELERIFDPALVVTEWSVRRGAHDTFSDVATYAPRLDVAVGPFNTTFENRRSDSDAIRAVDHKLVSRIRDLVWQQNDGEYFENPNPRCLLAIEVENNTSSKHILGGITNASLLGLLAVLVGSTERIAKVRRIHVYASKLKQVGKARRDMFGNVACFSDTEFLKLLRDCGESGGRGRRR